MVRRVKIPLPGKLGGAGGGERPLGIPTVRDRVAQTAAKLAGEPIFEADLHPEAYGRRPKRSAQDAIRRVHQLLCQGCADVVAADLSRYFDTIPHAELMRCVARRISDRWVLKLTSKWLQAPAEERDENGKRRMTGERGEARHAARRVVEPFVGNLYTNRYLKHWREKGKGRLFRAVAVNYANDFVMLSRGSGPSG